MPKLDKITDRWPVWVSLAIAAVTLWRVVLLYFNQTELYVDESQYWLWGTEPAFGYYSKPPLIGWIIGLVTAVTGSDSPFAIRLAAPLFHAATAGLVWLLARDISDPRTAALSALTYLTLPAVTLGSLLMTTDTPMLFFLALATLCWMRLAKAGPQAQLHLVITLGLAVGLGVMSKYAMLYAMPGLFLLAVLEPAWRIRWRDAVWAGLVALIVVLPNLIWNVTSDFPTLRHTIEIASWTGLTLHPGPTVRFLAEQFAVFGPILFAAWLVQLVRVLRGLGSPPERAMLWLCLPILGVVTGQAMMSHALANWAVGTYVAGSILAVMLLLARAARFLTLSLALHLALAFALPLVTVIGTDWRLPNGKLMLSRYAGHAEISRFAIDAARKADLDTVVASDRSLLADLFYHGRSGEVRPYSVPFAEPVPHHFALKHPLPAGHTNDVLYLTDPDRAIPCKAGAIGQILPSPIDPAPIEVARMTAGPGWAEGRVFVMLRVPATCWRST